MSGTGFQIVGGFICGYMRWPLMDQNKDNSRVLLLSQSSTNSPFVPQSKCGSLVTAKFRLHCKILPVIWAYFPFYQGFSSLFLSELSVFTVSTVLAVYWLLCVTGTYCMCLSCQLHEGGDDSRCFILDLICVRWREGVIFAQPISFSWSAQKWLKLGSWNVGIFFN